MSLVGGLVFFVFCLWCFLFGIFLLGWGVGVWVFVLFNRCLFGGVVVSLGVCWSLGFLFGFFVLCCL